MTTATAPPRPAASDRLDRVVWIGLGAELVVVALAMIVPAVTGWEVRADFFPPLRSSWDPRVGAGTVPAVAIAVLGSIHAIQAAQTFSWKRLLLASWATGLAWMLALAFVDGPGGVGNILNSPLEYLQTARATTDLPHALSTYVDRIPYSAAPNNWPEHIAGHPPGALTFFVVLVRLGLGSGFAAGMVVTLLAATIAPAVLIAVRNLGAEDVARKAAPFLVLGTAAIWQCVSADGMFSACTAWGLAALSYSATRTRTRPMLIWGSVAGLLLGYAVMLSYGLPLIGILALAVLVVARSWRPLVPAVLAALAVVLAFAAFGFAWWEAIGVLRHRYWDGIAGIRPGWYWIWGNLAALALSAGPLVAAGLTVVVHRRKEIRTDAGVRLVAWLSGAAAATVLLADASQMSRAEVERIWLPFVPWLLLGCALLPVRWRRGGLVLQVVAALLIQHLLATTW